MPTKSAALEAKLDQEKRLRELTTRIHALPFEDILLKIKDDMQRLLDCERVTIYALDARRNELYSRVKDGAEIKEIRLPVNTASCAGYVAMKKRGLNLRDAYDAQEIAQADPALRFDETWDRKTGFHTKQLIAFPIQKDKSLYGVIQAMNTRATGSFNDEHQGVIAELAETLAVAFHNNERMSIRSSPLDYLLRTNLVTQEQLDQATMLGQKEGHSVEYVLHARHKVPKAEIARSLSEFYRTEYVFFSPELSPPQDLLAKFTIDYLKHHCFVPLRMVDDKAVIAMTNPRALTLLDDISKRLGGMRIETRVGTREDIVEIIDLFFRKHDDDPPASKPGEISDLVKSIEDERAALQPQSQQPKVEGEKEDDEGMIRLVNRVIETAIDRGASDIHIEPAHEGKVRLRIRIDGLCVPHYEDQQIPQALARAIIARLKIMAHLDIAEHRLPQDGKIRFGDFGAKNVELRVATIPTTGGNEDMVMRILAASKPIPLDQIGMTPENYEAFKKAIDTPYGIILCVGPTGSGKTTTLHSALGSLNKPDVKIWTAEDPVEITQAGLRQVQMHSKIGLTFERALRSFLRLDPDIIMIGEMRDFETAGAAVEASLTGHLVFSTLHTNNAPETVTRMLDLGLDPFTFGDSLIAILAQRLTRTACKDCKILVAPTDEQWAILRHDFGDDALFDRLAQRDKAQVAQLKGCPRCSGTGYRGRMGVHELLVVDDELRHMIYRKSLSSELRTAAIKKGMIMLKQDGIRKVLQGRTDLNEIRAVCTK